MRSMINLLPPSYRRQQIIRHRVVQWSSLICLALLSAWAWHWYERREDRALVQQLELLEREHEPTQRLLQQLVEMRQNLEELQQQEAVAIELERQRSALVLLGVISQSARQTGGRLRLTKMELTNFQSAGVEDSAASTGAYRGGLLLTGVSLDNPAVGELLDRLQDAGIFNRVELLALKERADAESILRDYEVRCEF
jgi:hypothetical protein